jgi:hypothetical protein
MNTRNLVNLGLAFALTGLVILAAYNPDKTISASSVILTQIKPEEVQKLVIEQALQGQIFKQMVLIKNNDQWQMSQPYSHLANTLRINKLLKLSLAKSHAQYKTADINLKQLKLSFPDLIISLNKTKLFFGTTDALKGYRYIRINDTVHLITDRFSHLVHGKATALISPALLPKKIMISKLVLPELTLQLNDAGWKTTRYDISISADQLQQFLNEWRFSRALRVSRIADRENGQPIEKNDGTIELYNNKNHLFKFNLIRSENEIILSRPDTGLRYHFAIETGERLLKPLSKPANSS